MHDPTVRVGAVKSVVVCSEFFFDDEKTCLWNLNLSFCEGPKSHSLMMLRCFN
jgi:hypothetical protein